MTRAVAGLALLLCGSAAAAAATPTDFGVREVGSRPSAPQASSEAPPAGASWTSVSRPVRAVDLRAISALGSRWGTVTSTYRSPERNRRVGGARNSYHLRGRAIDIARRPGVTHAQIAAAYRAAGYHLVESLDEGDHSHFAFGTASGARRTAVAASEPKGRTEVTAWRIVSAPGGLR
jgi:hypothetical protein